MPQAMRDRLASSDYHARLYRSPETIQREEMLEEFLDFVKDEFEMSNEELDDLQVLINEFVGYDIKKAKQGEKEMLARWTESAR